MFKRTLFILLFLFLGACNPSSATPTAQAPTQTQIQSASTQTISSEPEFDPLVISPENIDHLEIVDRFGKGYISDMDISPDGKTAALSTSRGVYLYDMQTLDAVLIDDPRMNYIMRQYEGPAAVAFSPDGQTLAIAYDWIFFWDLGQETIVRSIKNINADFRIDNMGFSHDGQQLITMGDSKSYSPCDSWGGNFQVIDIPTEALNHHSFYCKQMSVQYFHTTGNGKIYLTAATTSPDYRGFETIVLDASTGKILERIRDSFDERILSINPSGSLYAIGVESGNDIVDTSTQGLAYHVEGSVIFLPETDNILVANREVGWHLQDVEGNVLCIFESDAHKLSISSSVYQSQYKIKGGRIISRVYSPEEGFDVWNTTDCKFEGAVRNYPAFFQPIFSSDGNRIITETSKSFSVWDISTGLLATSIPTPGVQLFSVHPERGQIFVVPRSSAKNSIEIYDFNNGNYLGRLEGDYSFPRQIVASPDGNLVAILSEEKLDLWDLDTKSIYYSSDQFKRDKTYIISFSQDSSELILLDFSLEPKLKITMNAKTGQIIKKEVRPEYGYTVFSHDNKVSASVAEERNILVRNEFSGALIHELVGHYRMGSTYDTLSSLEFTKDDRMLVTIGNNIIRFWDVRSGLLLGEIAPDFSVRRLAISPDGHYMATTGADGTIRLWAIVYTYEP